MHNYWDFPILKRRKIRYRVMRTPDRYVPYCGEVCKGWGTHWVIIELQRDLFIGCRMVLKEISVTDYFEAMRSPFGIGARYESGLDKVFRGVSIWD